MVAIGVPGSSIYGNGNAAQDEMPAPVYRNAGEEEKGEEGKMGREELERLWGFEVGLIFLAFLFWSVVFCMVLWFPSRRRKTRI